MVTPVGSSAVNEGDCRYLPIEILQDDYSQLQKADIFSLAMTIFEAVSCLHMANMCRSVSISELSNMFGVLLYIYIGDSFASIGKCLLGALHGFSGILYQFS